MQNVIKYSQCLDTSIHLCVAVFCCLFWFWFETRSPYGAQAEIEGVRQEKTSVLTSQANKWIFCLFDLDFALPTAALRCRTRTSEN